MPDFNVLTPPITMTNPTNLPVGGEFPRVLYKWNTEVDDLNRPKFNLLKTVWTEDEKAAALADGWSLTQLLKAPKAAKG